MQNKNELLRSLPKVDEALQALRETIEHYKIPRRLAKKGVRAAIDRVRADILAERYDHVPTGEEQWHELLQRRLIQTHQPHYQRVINGAGIVVHTNLGRSLLPDDALSQLSMGATSYSNLEFDLTTGKRGSRYTLVEDIICDLTGAEAALVVNNNAAAVLIALDTIARGKEVIVSRGQLVEIGGSFRVPDVMAKSGATLVEVGATNRTHLYDYERAITENTALMLQVHTSNFRMIGFTSQVSAEQLVGLGAEKNILVMEDLGSGCFIDLSKFGLPAEPTVQDAVKSGVDVVTFSGDKLLGGPQAGLIVGKKDTIDKIKKNPLNRALRIDKFTLASLESVLRHYYDINEALTAIPTLRMISEEPGVIKRRVQRFLRRTKHIEEKLCTFKMVKTQSMVGGGALPEYCLDGWGVEISPQQIDISTMERGFRSLRPPIIGRIERERYILDFRTISDKDVKDLVDVLTGYFHGDAVGS
jgi:L-seryl-tRNA(Ser) seleniumtransferase